MPPVSQEGALTRNQICPSVSPGPPARRAGEYRPVVCGLPWPMGFCYRSLSRLRQWVWYRGFVHPLKKSIASFSGFYQLVFPSLTMVFSDINVMRYFPQTVGKGEPAGFLFPCLAPQCC